VAWLTFARLAATSDARLGISNLTGRSPSRTASPSDLGISAIRAGAGAMTVNSAPGEARSSRDAAIVL
jgi:hypothetical protein